MRNFILFFIVGFHLFVKVNAQVEEKSAAEFQQDLNAQFKDIEESPLKKKAKRFKGHNFFPIDSIYRVEANFVRMLNAIPFQMKTTTSRLPIYEKYGEAVFTIQGEELRLGIFQSHGLREDEEYENHLFLPFTDLTNGEESYAGGRFLDLEIPEGDVIIIDFNKAYNPYCAYNSDYSCPIPPAENDLKIKILAGVRSSKN
jgi:uncharacterized protein (DUF1684 family)